MHCANGSEPRRRLSGKASPLCVGFYHHADAVDTPTSGTLTVFNICGNKYRLIVRIKYVWQLINLRCVLTHKEYDAGRWKE